MRADGRIMWQSEHSPFGQQTAEAGLEQHTATYTGKDYDEDAGLYYFNARWYDAELGRFVTLDPARDGSNCDGQDGLIPTAPWMASRRGYAYVRNNPLGYVDPTGLELETIFEQMQFEHGSVQSIDPIITPVISPSPPVHPIPAPPPPPINQEISQSVSLNKNTIAVQVPTPIPVQVPNPPPYPRPPSANNDMMKLFGDVFVFVSAEATVGRGNQVSTGVVLDLDSPLESGIFRSVLDTAGINVSVGPGAGYVLRDIEGYTPLQIESTFIGDTSIAAITDSEGINGVSVSLGPSWGTSTGSGYTETLSIVGILDSIFKKLETPNNPSLDRLIPSTGRAFRRGP